MKSGLGRKSVVFVVFLLVCGSAYGQPWLGSGDANDPYQIWTAEDMQAIGADSSYWHAHFKLMADIDLGAYTGTSFNIIGNGGTAFTGVFDGNGHTISNFTYECDATDCIGLFGSIDEPYAEIKDLGLIDPNIDAGSGGPVGCLVGWKYFGNISGCYVEGGSVTGGSEVGGLIGRNSHEDIQGRYSTCSVTGAGRFVGGLVGWNQGEISDCNSTGSVTGGSNYIGGLVGNNGVYDSLPDVVGIVIKVDNSAPIADGGADRYAGEEPIVLDGTRSFDPDGYGIVGYSWQQISGPNATFVDADTARPTVTLPRSTYVQKCRFELVVSDGELESKPDSVDVTVVPAWGSDVERLYQLNPPFDPNKPTFVAFGGGYGCDYGTAWGSSGNWEDKANVITFDEYYSYYSNHYGDKLIVYLSEAAPDYREPIQTIGFSAGNKPAIKIARYMNRAYSDGRYAINRVTFLDEASFYCNNEIPGDVSVFLANPVEDEQCWVDTYIAETGEYNKEVLNVRFPAYHGIPPSWYRRSLDANSWVGGDIYNGGITAGEFISVIGPGKNLQLAGEHADKYYFKWSGEGPDDVWDDEPDSMLFFDESHFPGRLPEPVVLVGPEYGALVDSNGAILSCEESENAVGYELWMGLGRYDMLFLVSDTPSPPNEIISTFPSETTWWTIKARDAYGSTIYADASCIKLEEVAAQGIKNTRKRKNYSSIQRAINDASDGDEIVILPGCYQYRENINLKGRNVTVRSAAPEDPAVVAATVINGGNKRSVVTFCSGEDANCVLAGLSITGGSTGEDGAGVLCLGADTKPTIRNCMIIGNAGVGLYFGDSFSPSSPTVRNCTIAGNGGVGIKARGRSATSKVRNCTIVENKGGGIDRRWGNLTVRNCVIWGNGGEAIYGGGRWVTYCDIEGGLDGEGNIDAEPLFVEAGYWDANGTAGDVNDDFWVEGDYHLLEGSPCIDSGDPNYLAGPGETDLDGRPRVADGDGDGNSVVDMGAYEAEPPAIEVEVKFTPEMLNCESRGDWVEAHFVLPEGYLPEDVDVNVPAVAEPIGAVSEHIEIVDEGEGNYGVVAVFDREGFCEALGGDAERELEVTVEGAFTDGVEFYGTDTIKLISDHWQHRRVKRLR